MLLLCHLICITSCKETLKAKAPGNQPGVLSTTYPPNIWAPRQWDMRQVKFALQDQDGIGMRVDLACWSRQTIWMGHLGEEKREMQTREGVSYFSDFLRLIGIASSFSMSPFNGLKGHLASYDHIYRKICLKTDCLTFSPLFKLLLLNCQ